MEENKKRTQLSLENELRDDLCIDIMRLMEEKYGEVYKVAATDTGLAYRLGSPCVDAERNEKTIIVAISIPRGSKDGTPYDLYTAKEDYEIRLQMEEEKVKVREEKKKREEEEKKRKQEVRKQKKIAKAIANK